MRVGLVSVILPVYNQKHTLKEAIEGVLSQEYSYLELILINDGSTDDPEELIRNYVDPRIKYYSTPNRGLPHTLNYGMSLASGEFMTWTSADNIMLPTLIGELVTALNKNPQAVAAYTGYYFIDAKGKMIGSNLKGPYEYNPRKFLNHPSREYLVAQHCNFGASFLYRADHCARIGEFDPECEGIEDVDYSIRLAQMGSVVYIEKLLYQYRLHDESMSGRERIGQISFAKGRKRFWEKVSQLRESSQA